MKDNAVPMTEILWQVRLGAKLQHEWSFTCSSASTISLHLAISSSVVCLMRLTACRALRWRGMRGARAGTFHRGSTSVALDSVSFRAVYTACSSSSNSSALVLCLSCSNNTDCDQWELVVKLSFIAFMPAVLHFPRTPPPPQKKVSVSPQLPTILSQADHD